MAVSYLQSLHSLKVSSRARLCVSSSVKGKTICVVSASSNKTNKVVSLEPMIVMLVIVFVVLFLMCFVLIIVIRVK